MRRDERRIRLDAGAHASLGIVGTQFGSVRERFDQRAMLVARKNDARVFRKIWGRRKDLPFQDFRQNVGYAQRIPYSNRNVMNHRLFFPFSNLVIMSTPLFADDAEVRSIRFSGLVQVTSIRAIMLWSSCSRL